MNVDNSGGKIVVLSLGSRILRKIFAEHKAIFLLALFTLIFFYKFFVFQYQYLGADILNHWYYPWAARPELRESLPERSLARRATQWGEKWGVGPVISRPSNPECSDPVFSTYPATEYCVKLIKKGEWPFWNPYQLGGFNQIADITFSFFHPFNLIFFLPGISVLTGMTLKVILGIYLLGLCFYWLLLDFGLSRLASLAASLTLMFSVHLISFAEFMVFTEAYFLLPIMILLFRLSMREGPRPYVVLTSLSIACLFFSRSPKPVSYVFVFWICYQIAYIFYLNEDSLPVRERIRRFFEFHLCGTLLGLAMGMALFLPTWKALALSQRTGETISSFLNFPGLLEGLRFASTPAYWTSLQATVPQLLINLFCPEFFGSSSKGLLWIAQYIEFSPYMGVIPVVLVIWHWLVVRGRRELFWRISAILLFLTNALIPPFYQFFAFLVPHSGALRLIFLFNFCMAVLFGMAIDQLRFCVPKSSRRFWIISSLVAAGGTLALALLWRKPAWFYQWIVQKSNFFGVGKYRELLSTVTNLHTPQAIIPPQVFNHHELWMLGFFLLFLFIAMLLVRFPNLLRYRKIFLGLVFLNLAFISINLNPTVKADLAYRDTATTDFLKTNLGDGRMMRYGEDNVLPAGAAAVFGITDAMSNIASVSNAPIFELFNQLDPQSATSSILGVRPLSHPEILRKKIFNAMSVKYLISSAPIPELEPLEDRSVAYDLRELLTQAEIQAAPDYVVPSSFLIENRRWPVILANTPSRATFHFEVPKEAVLKFGIAMNPESYSQPGDGAGFEVRIDDGTTQQELLRQDIDPKQRLSDRRIFWHEYDLGRFEGKKVSLQFVTDPLASPAADWAGWVMPRVTVPAGVRRENPILQLYRKVWDSEGVIIYENLKKLPRAFLVFGARVVSGDKNRTMAEASGKKNNKHVGVRPALLMDVKNYSAPTDLCKAVLSDDFDPARSIVLEKGKAIENQSQQIKPVLVRPINNSEVTFDTEADAESYLYVSDAYDPGWRVSIDGKSGEILRANYAFRAVYLTPGKHHVRMYYKPVGWHLGVCLAIGGLIFVMAQTIFRGIRRIR